jgi:hypothetical protein
VREDDWEIYQTDEVAGWMSAYDGRILVPPRRSKLQSMCSQSTDRLLGALLSTL